MEVGKVMDDGEASIGLMVDGAACVDEYCSLYRYSRVLSSLYAASLPTMLVVSGRVSYECT